MSGVTDRSDPPLFPADGGWTAAHRRAWQREADWVDAQLDLLGDLDQVGDTGRWVVLVRRRRRARRMLRAIDLSLAQ